MCLFILGLRLREASWDMFSWQIVLKVFAHMYITSAYLPLGKTVMWPDLKTMEWGFYYCLGNECHNFFKGKKKHSLLQGIYLGYCTSCNTFSVPSLMLERNFLFVPQNTRLAVEDLGYFIYLILDCNFAKLFCASVSLKKSNIIVQIIPSICIL